MRELREIAANAPMPPHGRRVVKALDDTFTVVRKRTSDLLREIIAANFDFEFTAGVRCDTLDDNIASKMALAGFKRVTLGVESGSPRILEAIRKGETNAQVIRATELLRVHGISSHAFFMVGFPGETEEDVALSKRLIEKARPDYVEVNLVTPYPGTELYERLVDAAPERITGWYRWFHQGWAVYAQNAGFDVDKVYADFVGFASEWNRGH
jgi:radical SAM superfamily enzyme YgiQ (UPF0313 family)